MKRRRENAAIFWCVLASITVIAAMGNAAAVSVQPLEIIEWAEYVVDDVGGPETDIYSSIFIDSLGNIHLAYNEAYWDGQAWHRPLFHAISTDIGVTWSSSLLPIEARNYVATIDNNDVIYVAGIQDTDSYLVVSADYGATWQVHQVTDTPYPYYEMIEAIDFDSEGRIFLVLKISEAGAATGSDLIVARSTGDLDIWDEFQMRGSDTTYLHMKGLSVDSADNLHLAYIERVTAENHIIYHALSANAGEAWTHNKITEIGPHLDYPSIDVDSGGNIFVLWSDRSISETSLKYAVSHDTGETWDIRLYKTIPYYLGESDLLIDEHDVIHIAFGDEYLGDTDSDGIPDSNIQYAVSHDGVNWYQSEATTSIHTEYVPDLAMSGQKIFISYTEYYANDPILVGVAVGTVPVSIVQDVIDYLQELPADCFKNNNESLRTAFYNKLQEIINHIEKEQYDAALAKLQNEILDKIYKWIDCPDAQAQIVQWIEDLVELLGG